MELPCGTCGKDLNDEGQWLRCRAHYIQSIRDLEEQVEQLKRENMCDVCTGSGVPVSGPPCMCGGTGKMSDAVDHIRRMFVESELKNERILRRTRELKDLVIDASVNKLDQEWRDQVKVVLAAIAGEDFKAAIATEPADDRIAELRDLVRNGG